MKLLFGIFVFSFYKVNTKVSIYTRTKKNGKNLVFSIKNFPDFCDKMGFAFQQLHKANSKVSF